MTTHENKKNVRFTDNSKVQELVHQAVENIGTIKNLKTKSPQKLIDLEVAEYKRLLAEEQQASRSS